MVKELQKLPQKIGIEWGLKRFPSAQVQLNEIELEAVSLHDQRCPSVALLGVGVNMVDEVSGGKQGEEAACGASVASGFCLDSLAFPTPTVEILQGGVQGFPLEVCLLEEHDGVSLCPDPVLHLFAKEGDIGESDVEGLVASARFLRKVFSYFHGCVRDQFISGSSGEPNLRDLSALLKTELRQRGGKGPIISQPVDVVSGQNGLVVSILMCGALMKHHCYHLIRCHVDVKSIFRKGQVDLGV